MRRQLEHIFKDKEFIDAYMEPFERFTDDGRGIPLGIRPSQDSGNLTLTRFDRFLKEVAKAHLYIRYLDDFVIFGKTKGEVKRKMKMATAFLKELGFEAHEPKIRPISEGLDFLGFVYYEGGDMFWRKSDKVRLAQTKSQGHQQAQAPRNRCSSMGNDKMGKQTLQKII